MSTLVLDLFKLAVDENGQGRKYETIAIKNGDFVIHIYNDSVMIGDARNFNKRGVKCKNTFFSGDWWKLREILQNNYPALTLEQLFDGEVIVDGLTIRDVENQHPRLFTIDKLDTFGKMTAKGLQKLQEVSKKIDKLTFLKLLASGKVTSIEQSYVYTDDYVLDAERNFCTGNERSIEGIVDDALNFSGFHSYVSSYNEDTKEGLISFSIHSNNSVSVHYSLAS